TNFRIEDSIVAGNRAGRSTSSVASGGGIYQNASLSFGSKFHTTENVDFWLNQAVSAVQARGGAMTVVDASERIVQTNFVDNDVSGTTTSGAALSASNPFIGWCNTFGNTGAAPFSDEDPGGTNGNVSVDPLYVFAQGTDPAAWNFRLLPGSPVIDAGDPGGFLQSDGTTPDIGAYGVADW
ncbi:MAG: choice-of-anchor Q domain-containing protein, partial [Myxococcota bacterium]